ncbi:zinc carboxypeptidase-like [Copidosoma floridanum]|uniref:zinc carboxypeptidase-like n=1 Tax=Copidosoma floridanum TaxID=29053 RepID=UPI0006C96D71|nr:zinc carboxypeptidase-like [Copidosoma floridanum]
MYRGVLFLALVALARAEERVNFQNYKVFEVTPQNDEQLDLLKELELNYNDYEYWRPPGALYQPAEVMVGPSREPDLVRLLRGNNVTHQLLVDDLQALIDQQNPATTFASSKRRFTWDRYHTLEEIYAWLDTLPLKYPNTAQVVYGGSTYEGRRIKGVKLTFDVQIKPGIFVDGGTHAREWIAPATVTYLINELLTSDEPEVRALANDYYWTFFPVVNPDGYVYTHTTNRLWRKTMSRNSTVCRGVDANRNWDYKWMKGGASQISCMPNYAGRRPFSEIETKSLSDYMRYIRRDLFAYVSFHSFSQLLLFPYGHTTAHLENYDELSAIAKAAVAALAKSHGTKYRYGGIAETLYVATGSSVDWAKAVLGLPIAYTYELRGRSPIPGFLLPAKQIVPNGEEVLDSLVAMFGEARKFGYP